VSEHRIDMLKDEIDELRESQDRLIHVLSVVAWGSGGFCGGCGEDFEKGHAHDCEIKAAIDRRVI